MRFLINDDGSVFNDSELAEIRKQLLDLKAANEHLDYRDQNSLTIAHSPASRLLIVSGPGTGKSYLFLERIKHWLSEGANEILVTSFVNKLVEDLEDDLKQLDEKEQKKVTVTTLHGLARGILEANGGTRKWSLGKHIKMIGQEWKELIWADVLQFHPGSDPKGFSWKAFERQLFNRENAPDQKWKELRNTYCVLTQFYNAVGFADLIIRANGALKENEDLNKYKYFIIDEYQDFNIAEEALLFELAKDASGLLIVGDDDQVLYEELKQGKADLLRSVYSDERFANAMLPLCSRCSYHIAVGADNFICQNSAVGRIGKVFIPCSAPENSEQINVVICAHPAGVIDYIMRFISNHKEDIENRAEALREGKSKDAFLLILSPMKDARFLGKRALELLDIIEKYSTEDRVLSAEVLKILDFHALGKTPNDNYAFRKVLHLEGLSPEECHPYISKAIETKSNLADIEADVIRDLLAESREVFHAIDDDLEFEERLEILRKYGVDEGILELVIQRLSEAREGAGSLEEADSEADQIEISRMNPIEMMTIVGSKGLSADHVIVIGCDDVNMSYLSEEAFYVALTRARMSLHLLTSLKCGGATKQHEYLDRIPEDSIKCYKHSKSKGLVPLVGRTDFREYIESILYAQEH